MMVLTENNVSNSSGRSLSIFYLLSMFSQLVWTEVEYDGSMDDLNMWKNGVKNSGKTTNLLLKTAKSLIKWLKSEK